MANAGAHSLLDPNLLQSSSNTVFLVPVSGPNYDNAEIASFLAGLPQLQNVCLPNDAVISNANTTPKRVSASRKFKKSASSNDIQGFSSFIDSNLLESATISNQIAKSNSLYQVNSSVNSIQLATPVTPKQVLNPISPNILTPAASPIGSPNTVISNPNFTSVRGKQALTGINTTTVTPKITGLDIHQADVTINVSCNATNGQIIPEKQQSANKDVKPFATLVFFDLETTGLGHMIGKSNVQITEISMVAIDRKEFWQSKNSDLKDVRIIHKLSMCVRPRSAVSPGAAKITGLDNYNLVDQYPFDRNAANTIISFLSHLPKPACLLAHNGNAFDFPLLKAELKRLSMQLPNDLMVADTLTAFKSIGIAESPPDRKVCKSVKYGKNGRLSHSLENLHLFFFNRKPTGGHSSEGDCLALAKVCHIVKEDALPWIEANSHTLENVIPM